MKLIRSVIPLPRFYGGLFLLICLYVLAFFMPVLYGAATVLLLLFLALLLFELINLFAYRNPVVPQRHAPARFSLSDANTIELELKNKSSRAWNFSLTDELPAQLQIRNFRLNGRLEPQGIETLHYSIRPLERGEYLFGNLNLFLNGPLGLMARHLIMPLEQRCKVYPSIVQMKAFELHTLSEMTHGHGIRKLKRTGHSYEFDQIKNYVPGDDVRQINWRSSARTRNLMVNRYEDEKSQQVYCLIDKSRSMLMPFNGLSLLDYAINASLAISNVVLKKQDKAGLFTFSDKIGTAVRAESGSLQLKHIMEALYKQKERDLEADYGLLYNALKQMAKTRSLLFLFTNFESLYAMRRVLPVLRKINARHLLIPVFFENSELYARSMQKAPDSESAIAGILAAQMVYEKRLISRELSRLGIHNILCKPEELSVETINKYLEIKSRGLL